MDQVIVLDVALSEFANTLLSAQQDTSIIQFIDTNDRAIDSTVEISNTHNVFIADPLPSITSTLVIPNPNVIFNINPLSIATTVNFGVAGFIDNIHRLLVFKNDNISKVGENDAVVIAGGIRINPSSTVSETATSGSATLPNSPVGFISVTIGGTDYLMPYYNA